MGATNRREWCHVNDDTDIGLWSYAEEGRGRRRICVSGPVSWLSPADYWTKVLWRIGGADGKLRESHWEPTA